MADVPGYPWLQTARDDVDIKDVDPVLLQRMNALAKSRQQIVTIFSGYRSSAYNKQVGGAQDSQHTHGRAIDATIGGQPIGSVVSQSEFAKFKLRNGNQPGFFHGQPDPAHTDLGLGGTLGGGATPAKAQPTESPPKGTQAVAGAPVLTPAPNPYSSPPPIAGGVVSSGPLSPGSVPADFYDPQRVAQNWQRVASLPGASSDAVAYARLAQEAAGGG